uniref:Uncharacterized protein n=1 Tax=Anguilla anguilla TaxID=7936 RepID=A0A0E9QLN1_ANGAN
MQWWVRAPTLSSPGYRSPSFLTAGPALATCQSSLEAKVSSLPIFRQCRFTNALIDQLLWNF